MIGVFYVAFYRGHNNDRSTLIAIRESLELINSFVGEFYDRWVLREGRGAVMVVGEGDGVRQVFWEVETSGGKRLVPIVTARKVSMSKWAGGLTALEL